MSTSSSIEALTLQLLGIFSVKFGNFNSGGEIISSLRNDLCTIISYPDVLQQISKTISSFVSPSSFDRLCGLSYPAQSIATCVSVSENIPMVMLRKRDIGGDFEPDQRCLIIVDLLTSGRLVLDAARLLRDARLEVSEAVALIDMEKGGREELEKNGIKLHALIKLTEMMKILREKGMLDEETNLSKGPMRKRLSERECDPCTEVELPTIAKKTRIQDVTQKFESYYQPVFGEERSKRVHSPARLTPITLEKEKEIDALEQKDDEEVDSLKEMKAQINELTTLVKKLVQQNNPGMSVEATFARLIKELVPQNNPGTGVDLVQQNNPGMGVEATIARLSASDANPGTSVEATIARLSASDANSVGNVAAPDQAPSSESTVNTCSKQ